MASNSDNLYVTFIDIDQHLLKVWGQRSRVGATYIESQLLQLIPEFNRTHCPSPSRIKKGMFCFAKYTDDNYYRARVISNVQGDTVGVLFIDYGNRDFINISNVRIQEGREGDPLVKMAEQAEEYYLARVAAPSFGWTKDIISEIRRDICYDEFPYRVADQVGDQKILEIKFHNEDFSNYLVKKQFAQPLTLPIQKQMILSYCSLVSNDSKRDAQFKAMQEMNFSSGVAQNMRPPFRPTTEMQQQMNFEKQGNFPFPPPNQHQHPVQYPTPRMSNPVTHHMNKPSPRNLFHSAAANHHRTNIPVNTSPAPVNPALKSFLGSQYNPLCDMKGPAPPFNNVIEVLAQQVKQYIAEDNAKAEEAEKIPHNYVNSVLEVGSTYNVFISYVDDGPWSFSIQLLSSESKLEKLIEELSSCELVPVKPPIILGHPCIASSALYKTLCRGVVVSISHSAVKVYFVDIGNTEDLPSSSIYELPPKFFKTRVLSQKFSLSGLQKVAYSDDIKKFFREVVQDQLLMLRVTSLEDDNLPTCELYLKDTNIKRILNEKIRESRIQEEFPKPGDTENVIVTWVVSPQKFFVQLQKREPEINALKKELTEVDTRSQPLTLHQLSVGLKCVCHYEADGQWYRAMITAIDSENEITVFYIDYGNTEVVKLSNLRIITSPCLINQMGVQVIECSLKGFENQSFDQTLANTLETWILEKELQMTVVSANKEHLCVQLFENGTDILAKLLSSTPKVNSPVKSQSNTDSDWKSPPSGGVEVPLGRFKADNKFTSNPETFQRREKNLRPDNNRSDDQENWKHSNKFPSGRGFKQDKDNNWNDTKPQRNQRGFREHERRDDNGGDWKGNSGRFDDKKGEGMRFERGTSSSRMGGPDSKKKFTGDRGGRSDRPKSTRVPIKREDAAPPGSKYENKVISVGSCEKGIVTYYFSPDEFYVQLLNEEDEFKKMMEDIQIYYKDKYSIRDPLQAGDIVIAQYSLDKVLYRAEVVKPSPVTVRYVDYGNHEPVGQKETWLVDKKFLKLPKQVIKCRLANVKPIGLEWPPPGGDLVRFFEFEEYKFTFLGVQDEFHEISMEVVGSGKDVASEIIAAGLGQPVSSKMNVPKVDYSLLPKQVLRLFVAHVESSSKFYVNLNSKAVDAIEEDIRVYAENEKNLTALEESLLKPEMPCLSTRDSVSWHRGIIKKTEGDKVLIWFSDKGDSVEVTRDKVVSLPAHLKVFQPQVAECYLHGISDAVNEDEFKKTVESNHHLISIVSADNERLGVVLYDENGQKSHFQKQNDSPQTIDPVSYLPIISQKASVMISHLESPKEIYIQRVEDTEALTRLSEDLSEFCENSQENYNLEELHVLLNKGALVAAKSVVYETWYRGRLSSASEEGLEVFYIDYGNKESLPAECFKRLDDSFFRSNALSKKVSLDVEWKENDLEEVNKKLLELTQDRELIGYFINNEGQFISEFMIDEKRLTDALESEGLVSRGTDKFKEILTDKKMVESAPVAEKALYKTNLRSVVPEDLKVVVSHIDSPKKFWVHKESEINDLHELQETLQTRSETLPEKEVVNVGDIVSTFFMNMWFRAKVLSVGENTTLQLVDYGKVFTVDSNCNKIKELPQELMNVPTFAACYGLQGTWSDNKTSQLEEIIMESDEPVNLVVLEEGDPVVVDLIQNGQSITEKLLQEPLGDGEESEDGDLCVVFVSHCNSPDDFYIQRESCKESSNAIVQRLSEGDTFESASLVQENEVYVAKLPGGETWGRAKAVKKHPDGTEMFFIDTGKTAKVTNIRCLPSDLVDVPPLAENCSLVYGNACDTWSEAACEKFKEFADGRSLKMKTVVNRVIKPIVRLFHENTDISGELEPLCENDGRFEVYVSHALSPTDFYIQALDDENYKTVAEALETGHEYPDLEDKSPGSLCQALFLDDGMWYRGKIIQNLDEGCEIFFLDFGNVSVTTDVKKLPPELENIPPIALRCSLNLPERNIPESVKEEFINLTAGGETVFRARIITPGEVNVVSLKLDGRILDETLNIETISYESLSSFSTAQNHRGLDDETDDDKNSKKNLMTDYLISNLEDDAKAESSIRNETDEEKRVKIAFREEGFKSDDEKGISEVRILSGIVNATDNELMEEPEEVGEESDHGAELNGEEENDPTPEDVDEGNPPEETSAERIDSNNKTENGNSLETENEAADRRNKVHKIVPGCISRGEHENGSDESSSTSHIKLEHSERVVPGSISRGISLESMASEREATEGESLERQASQSAPSTPTASRRGNENGYVKLDPSDRVVPGCISTGIPLNCKPDGEKLPVAEKIVPGSVNGSAANE